MKRLLTHKETLSNEQVRFIQNAVQRFEAEADGIVKTKHILPKTKKAKNRNAVLSSMDAPALSSKAKDFIDRLVKLDNEYAALAAIQHLSDADVERLAREQGLRANSPDVARSKLAETITTLREIERIAGAGTKNTSPIPD